MKRIIRHFAIDTFCLYLISSTAKGIVFQKGFETLFIAGIGITLVSIFAKPIINLLLLPLNLITFGFFRWVASAVILYITTLIVPAFKIVEFNYPGFSSKWLDIPNMGFEGFWAYVGFSFLLSLYTSFIYWLIK